MRKELDAKLVKAFPNLYKDRYKDMRTTCMCWGFDCGDGWFDSLWDLSWELEKLIVKHIKDYPECPAPKATQVKEKFGSLRLYMSYETKEMEDLIEKAEELSSVTCEDCGKPGKLIAPNGWYRCLCDDCLKEREVESENN